MTESESLEIISELITRLEAVERDMILMTELSALIRTFDVALKQNQCPKTHAMIAGIIAYHRNRKAV